jgi:hypothetical protein
MKNKKHNAVQEQHDKDLLRVRNFARGQVGAANSREYSPNFVDRRANFDLALRQTALLAGRNLLASDHHTFLSWMESQSKLISTPNFRNNSANYRGLSGYYDLEEADFDRQMLWTANRISFSSASIIKYERAFHRLEAETLSGDIASARKSIESIEREFGATIRLLEVKIALEQFYFGLEAQKKLCAKMRGSKHAGLIGFLIYYISMRNEPSVPLSRYENIVGNRIEGLKDGPFRDYIAFRLAEKIPTSQRSMANVLRIEEAHSVFDLYDTFLKITAGDVLETSIALKAAQNQVNALNIRRIESGKGQDSIHPEWIEKASVQSVYKRICRTMSQQHVASPIEIYSLSLCASGLTDRRGKHSKRTVLASVVDELAQHYNLYSDPSNDYSELAKISRNFGKFATLEMLSSILSDDHLHWVSRKLIGQTGASLVLPKENSARLLVPALGFAKLRAIAWLRKTRANTSDESASRFVDFVKNVHLTGIRLIDINVRLAFCRALVQLNDFPNAWKAVSALIIDEEVNPAHLPLYDIFRTQRWRTISANANLAKLAICVDLQANTETSEGFDTLKRYSLEDLLKTHGVAKPSDLLEESLGLSRREYIYFLRNICVPRSMELLPSLNGTAAISAERRAILSILINIDRESNVEYNQEILTLIRRERVQQGLKLVDGSRIHVDGDVLIRKNVNSISVDFDRYKRLVSAGVGVAKQFEDVLKNVYKPIAEQEILSIPENEADDLLLDLIGRLRDSFLFDETNGFDSYLGRRVRHNSMTGNIRAPLSQEKIITQYSKATCAYEKNSYWLEKFKELPAEDMVALDKTFTDFAVDFDSIGNDIKTRLFQVRSKEFADGIFYINLSSNTYHLLRSLAQRNIRLEEFVQSCFETFWAVLAAPLDNAKSIMRRDARAKYESSFNALKANIANIESQQVVDLTAAIERARQAVFSQLATIVEWFSKSEINEQRSIWNLDEIIDICIEVCLVTHRPRDPVIDVEIEGEIALGSESLFILSDILWIAIDNACTHSGFASQVPIKLVVKYDEVGKTISIDIENMVDPTVHDAAWTENINSLIEDIEKRRTSNGLRVEGRSGLKKIAAMAFSVEGGNFSFGVRNHGAKFGVSVVIPTLDLPDRELLTESQEHEETEITEAAT